MPTNATTTTRKNNKTATTRKTPTTGGNKAGGATGSSRTRKPSTTVSRRTVRGGETVFSRIKTAASAATTSAKTAVAQKASNVTKGVMNEYEKYDTRTKSSRANDFETYLSDLSSGDQNKISSIRRKYTTTLGLAAAKNLSCVNLYEALSTKPECKVLFESVTKPFNKEASRTVLEKKTLIIS